jgi:hypothetical protein
MNESMTRQPDEVPITQTHIVTDACLGLLKTLGLGMGISTCLAMIILLLTSTSAII